MACFTLKLNHLSGATRRYLSPPSPGGFRWADAVRRSFFPARMRRILVFTGFAGRGQEIRPAKESRGESSFALQLFPA
jgi:hypothetical protein